MLLIILSVVTAVVFVSVVFSDIISRIPEDPPLDFGRLWQLSWEISIAVINTNGDLFILLTAVFFIIYFYSIVDAIYRTSPNKTE